MRWALAGAQVVGAMRPWKGESPFGRAAVVLGQGDDHRLIVERYVGGEAEGELVDPEGWRGLLETEEALELPRPLPAGEGGAFWLLRASFGSERQGLLSDLAMAEVLLALPVRGEEDAIGLYVAERQADVFRDRYAARAFDEAWTLLRAGELDRALSAANRAFVLERTREPGRLGLLIALMELLGRKNRAEGYLAMARRSFGEEFAHQVGKRAISYRAEIPKTDSAPRPARAPKPWNEVRRKGIVRAEAGLGHRKAA